MIYVKDLIEVCTKLDGRKKMVKNLKLDQKALELKKVNLERKIKNANIYLNEIDLHKKKQKIDHIIRCSHQLKCSSGKEQSN